MKERYIDNNLYYIFEEVNDKKIDHLFSSRIGWKNEDDLINTVFNSDKKIISLKQVHGSETIIVDDEFIRNYNKDIIIEGDGLLTNKKNIILKTYHADCTPIYLIDEEELVIGVIHSGWKGTYLNILENSINKMKNYYNSKIENIKVYIGPSIKSCCYEVSYDLYEQFKNKYNYDDAYIERDGKYYLDIQIINYNHGLNLGILEENIINSNICTSCNVDKLYSYRSENGTKGRLITAITIIG